MWGWRLEICHMFADSLNFLLFIFVYKGLGDHGQRSYLELKINLAGFNLLMEICLNRKQNTVIQNPCIRRVNYKNFQLLPLCFDKKTGADILDVYIYLLNYFEIIDIQFFSFTWHDTFSKNTHRMYCDIFSSIFLKTEKEKEI